MHALWPLWLLLAMLLLLPSYSAAVSHSKGHQHYFKQLQKVHGKGIVSIQPMANRLHRRVAGSAAAGLWKALPVVKHSLKEPNKALWSQHLPKPPSMKAFKADPLPAFKAALDRVSSVLHPRLVARLPTAVPSSAAEEPSQGHYLFMARFNWNKQASSGDIEVTKPDICMPYCKQKVNKRGKKGKAVARREQHGCRVVQGYLAVHLGSTKQNKRRVGKPHKDKGCYEYAHRLVCLLFHGPPTPQQPQVSHTCHNSMCLNPRHLKWTDAKGNKHDSINKASTPLKKRAT